MAFVASAATATAPVGAQDQALDDQRYLGPVFDEVEVTSDVPYRDTVTYEGEAVTLELDIYEPAGDTAEQRPVVMLMFGGGFVGGDRTQLAFAAEDFARHGFVSVTIDYRIRDTEDFTADPVATILDAYDDAAAAVDWLRSNAATYRIDPDTIVPAGVSAGAILAWNLAWMPSSGDVRPEPTHVSGAVSIMGAPLLSEASPGDPPVIDFHAKDDAIVPYDWAEPPCTAAQDSGARCDLVSYETGGHGVVAEQLDEILRCSKWFIADAVLVESSYLPADAVPETCEAMPPGEPPPTTPPPLAEPAEPFPPMTPPTSTSPATTTPAATPVAGTPAFTG
jgi:acetyl esterase/lipase